MLMLEDFPSLSSWKSRIIATDHSEQILDRARSGTFSQLEVNRGLPAQMLVKYFTKVGVQWELRADVRKLVEFRNVNLIEPFPFGTSFDVVFLRNVLIYFDVPTKRAILEQVRKVMAPDGSLFLGAAETTINVDDGWERTGASGFPYYQTRK